MKNFRYVVPLVAALVLLASLACRRPKEPLPPVPIPSMVITTGGVAYYVHGLRIPGNLQEFEVKKGEATTWIPLDIIRNVRFTGIPLEGYRPVKLFLLQGEQVEGLMRTDMILLEGETEIGYWNMPLDKISIIDWGTH